ncbi:MAG: cation transporter [Bacteroidales bacterium]|jgi:copper chaperone CopZ
MKTLKALTISLVLFTVCFLPSSVLAQTKRNASIVEFNIKVNFQDAKGKALIEKEIKKEAGVSNVFANLATKLVTINFDGNTTDREKINLAIEKIGFTTELSSKEKKTVKSNSKEIKKKK